MKLLNYHVNRYTCVMQQQLCYCISGGCGFDFFLGNFYIEEGGFCYVIQEIDFRLYHPLRYLLNVMGGILILHISDKKRFICFFSCYMYIFSNSLKRSQDWIPGYTITFCLAKHKHKIIKVKKYSYEWEAHCRQRYITPNSLSYSFLNLANLHRLY